MESVNPVVIYVTGRLSVVTGFVNEPVNRAVVQPTVNISVLKCAVRTVKVAKYVFITNTNIRVKNAMVVIIVNTVKISVCAVNAMDAPFANMIKLKTFVKRVKGPLYVNTTNTKITVKNAAEPPVVSLPGVRQYHPIKPTKATVWSVTFTYFQTSLFCVTIKLRRGQLPPLFKAPFQTKHGRLIQKFATAVPLNALTYSVTWVTRC